MKFVNNPPDAASLMMSARSFGNYDLASALADLIDNSITAQSQSINITCLFNSGDPLVRVADDGTGMTEATLKSAMRPASTNAKDERSIDDLGRFGWGMKSASFSQCTRLTVVSRKLGRLTAADWDLNNIEGWRMGILSNVEIQEISSAQILTANGTEVIWRNCDRLSEKNSITQQGFNELVAYACTRLSLIFHKYLEPEFRGKKLNIFVNGIRLEPFDPFYRQHNATQPLQREKLRLDGKIIDISPFILPHFSKLNLTEHEKLGGEEGFLRNQGFYVYRNHRLIIHGTWFRLAKFGDLSQLVRIGVDIPNSLDEIWKITIDKSDAQLPIALRNRLKQLVDGLKSRSSKTFRSKGGKIDQPGKIAVWSRYSRHGEVRYRINRNHPLIEPLLDNTNQEIVRTATFALRVIEQTFPVASFSSDAGDHLDQIHQTETDPKKFIDMLEAAIPGMLLAVDGDLEKLLANIRITEPFSTNRTLVDGYLKDKRWDSE